MPLARSVRLLVLAAIGLCVACQRVAPVPEPVADSLRRPSAGPVIGTAGLHGGHAWLGIPYAEPPIGELRWRAPHPARPWSEVRESVAFGARCPQFSSSLEGASREGELIGDEDCLTLNVYAPAFAADDVPRGDERLPVMVWIHGGGNTIGAGSFYDGSHLASDRGLVVVTLNYRLGPLGWFRHAALRGADSSAEDRSGNFGTLDLIRALHWVRENVESFGGDPGKVTVFGESAGGRNTYALLISPLSEGLFQRAIVQSGGTGLATPAEAENLVDAAEPGSPDSSGEILLRALRSREGLADRDGAKARAAALSPAEVAALLRDLPVETLFALYAEDALQSGGFLRMPRLFMEPTVLPLEEYAAFGSGRYHRVPIITGTNRDENKLFLGNDEEYVQRWLGFIPRLRDPERYQRVADYLARGWKANAVDGIAPLLVAAQGPSVYAYRFDWDELPSLFGSDLAEIYGAAHIFEVPFVFGHFALGRRGDVLFNAENEPGRLELSKAMMSYWAEFAYHGDPGRGRDGTLPAWRPWDPSGPEADKYMVLDTSAGGGLRMASETVDPAQLLAELRADPGFASEQERCDVMRRLRDGYTRVEQVMDAEGTRLACAEPAGAAASGGE